MRQTDEWIALIDGWMDGWMDDLDGSRKPASSAKSMKPKR
jgi:hypothetical protein